ncbi:MAG: hypothetical protein ACOYLO_09920, partial [Ferruginibacter sp.]
KQITLACVSANVVFIVLAYFLRNLGTTAVIGILAVSALSFVGIIYYLRQKAKQNFVDQKKGQRVIKRHKILSLVPESMEME